MTSLLKNIAHRLKAHRGETLVETLAAVLISAVAIIALSTGIAVSARLNSDAHNHESAIRSSMLAAERADADDILDGGTSSITVTSDAGKTHSYTVTVYGDIAEEGGTSEVVSYSAGD